MKPDHINLNYRAHGTSIKETDHGHEYTIARTDSRGRYLPGCDEERAAYLAHAANLYPRLVETLEVLIDVYLSEGGSVPQKWTALLKECGE